MGGEKDLEKIRVIPVSRRWRELKVFKATIHASNISLPILEQNDVNNAKPNVAHVGRDSERDFKVVTESLELEDGQLPKPVPTIGANNTSLPSLQQNDVNNDEPNASHVNRDGGCELEVVKESPELDDSQMPKLVPRSGSNDTSPPSLQQTDVNGNKLNVLSVGRDGEQCKRAMHLPRGVAHESKHHTAWRKHKKNEKKKKNKKNKEKTAIGMRALVDHLRSISDKNLARRLAVVKAIRHSVTSLEQGSEFVCLGGIDVLRLWLEAVESQKNEHADAHEQIVMEILKLLQRLPVTLGCMQRTKIGSLVLSLSRGHTVIGALATEINEMWQSQVKEELAERQSISALFEKMPSLNVASVDANSVTALLEEVWALKLPSFEKSLKQKLADCPLFDLTS